MKNIYEFKKGDVIVRLQPSKSLGLTPINIFTDKMIDRGGDRSYMGIKMIFVGIANGQIYLKSEDEFHKAVYKDKLIDLSLDLWDDGWDYWFDPQKLLEGLEPEDGNSNLQKQIDNAIKIENYELANKLKSKLK